jgi:hypothetical protein
MRATHFEPLYLDNDTRLAVDYDLWPDIDYLIGDTVGLFTLDKARDINNVYQGELTETLKDLARRQTSRDNIERAVGLYLTLAGLSWKSVTLQGSSQGEWIDLIVYADFELEGSIETLRAYWAGEVYTVNLETREVYTHTDGRTIEQWETQDFMSGVIFSKNYTLEDHAREYGFLPAAA